MKMEDVYEIQKLMYEYGWRIDSGDFDGVCDLLKDAQISYDGKLAYDRNPKAYMMTLKPIVCYEDGTPKTCHMVIDPIIDVAEDGLTATGRSYTVVVQGVTGQFTPRIIWVDRKFDTFVKENGKWRFDTRNFITRAEGDTSGHLDLSAYKR